MNFGKQENTEGRRITEEERIIKRNSREDSKEGEKRQEGKNRLENRRKGRMGRECWIE